jgi:hypothetical protein
VIVEQWATPVDAPAKHPAATFGKRAQLAGWTVDYRHARGPLTTRRRPDEPNEQGKFALVETVELVDTLGVRACHPDGRRIAAWWVGRTFGEGWAASPRRNARPLGIRALTRYLTEIEEENVVNEEKAEHWGEIQAAAHKACTDLAEETESHPEDWDGEAAFFDGFTAGHAAAAEQAGDAYGEGYAAGLAAVAGHAQVWVKTTRRLDALRPGDVILGKGDRWFIVDRVIPNGPPGKRTKIIAYGSSMPVTVEADSARMVDVVERVAVADALATLKSEGIVPVGVSA